MVGSCAVFAQQQGESLIGTAPLTRRFVLIECPHPWAEAVGQSCGLPADLADQMKQWAQQWPETRFLLFTGQRLPAGADRDLPRRLMFFEAPESRLQTYRAMQIAAVAPERLTAAIADYFAARSQGRWPSTALPLAGRHLFICTHGRRDRCCGRYGYPLYRQATALLETLEQSQQLPIGTHIWQVSHIGGHRFAPTLIDLPEGRYYGALTLEDCRALLLRQGSLALLARIYRGWALLPEPVQVLERHLWQQQGWSWLARSVDYRLKPLATAAELPAQAPDLPAWQVDFSWGKTRHWQATLQPDASLSRTIFGSCGDETPLETRKYQIAQLQEQVQPAPLPRPVASAFSQQSPQRKRRRTA